VPSELRANVLDPPPRAADAPTDGVSNDTRGGRDHDRLLRRIRPASRQARELVEELQVSLRLPALLRGRGSSGRRRRGLEMHERRLRRVRGREMHYNAVKKRIRRDSRGRRRAGRWEEVV
jgi:hypothetical protein